MSHIGLSQPPAWQWAKRQSYDTAGLGSNRYQPFSSAYFDVAYNGYTHLAAGPGGEIYLLDDAVAGDVDGNPSPGIGSQDIVFSAFRCSGAFRWSRRIGSTGLRDLGVSVRTDAAGGVYVAGYIDMSGSGAQFGTDSTHAPTNKTMFLSKWDSSGKLLWLRLPQPDTISFDQARDSRSLLIDMDVDAQGNSYTLAYLSPGLYGGSYVVSGAGTHVLKYGAAGQFLAGSPVAIGITNGNPGGLRGIKITCDAARDRLLISGNGTYHPLAPYPQSGTMTVNGSAVGERNIFLASVSNVSGSFNWLKTGTNNFVGGIPHWALADPAGNVFVAGVTGPFGAFDDFRMSTSRGCPFLLKLAPDGKLLWAREYIATADPRITAIAIHKGTVAIAGRFEGKLQLPEDSIFSNIASEGRSNFLALLDAGSGWQKSLQKISKPHGADFSSIDALVADPWGNFYLSGYQGNAAMGFGPLTHPGVTGKSSEYLAKWGRPNCNCTFPQAQLSLQSRPGNTVDARYLGTIVNIDSVVWNWGDGQRQRVIGGWFNIVNHQYAAPGRYNVCVTVYSADCSEDTQCGVAALDVAESKIADKPFLSPNPAGSSVSIHGAAGGKAQLYSVQGQLLQQSALSADMQAISISTLPPGSYFVRIRMKNGSVHNLPLLRN